MRCGAISGSGACWFWFLQSDGASSAARTPNWIELMLRRGASPVAPVIFRSAPRDGLAFEHFLERRLLDCNPARKGYFAVFVLRGALGFQYRFHRIRIRE